MNQDNKIQSFTLEDLDAVVKIETKCHLIPWTRKNFNDSHNAKNLYNIIKNGDDIIGYCIGLFAVDECQLLNITVKSDFQKKGFGELMLKNLFNECKKANIINIFLEVRRSNSSAIRLYEKNGFNQIGVRNNYYQLRDGQEDAILMGLAI